MMRYLSLPWPIVGLLVAFALLAQQFMLFGFELPGTMSAAFLSVGAMALLFSMIGVILLPPRRIAYLLGFLVCAGLMGWALYLQFGPQELEPCPLCMFQRVAVCLTGLVFLAAFIHNPQRWGATVYAFLTLVTAGSGAALAARQVWLQALPKDLVPACGMGISYMFETMPFLDVIARTLQGTGECAEKAWVFLNLSIAGWSLVFFTAMVFAAFALVDRD